MEAAQDRLLGQLQEVDAYEFEEFIAELWRLQGWEAKVTKSADDGGIDVVAKKLTPFPKKHVIQVKRYGPSDSVGRPEVQQYASIRHEKTDVDTVIIVTTGNFTSGAKDVGAKLNVKLIDGPQLYNLIEALDAYGIAQSYIDSESDQLGVSSSADTESPREHFDEQTMEGDPLAVVDFEEDIGDQHVPILLPNLIKLRKEILGHIYSIQSELKEAEQEFSGQRYFDAVKIYAKAKKEKEELKRKIARYDAGLTQADTETVSHLPPTEKYSKELNQINGRIKDKFKKAFQISEQLKALEVLTNEIGKHVDTIEKIIEHGDQMRQQGEIENAHLKYKDAQRHLEQAHQTMDIYQALLNEYGDKTIDCHPGLSQEVSLSALESKISRKMESQKKYEDVSKIAENAAGSFNSGILTDNDGLYSKELINYVKDDESLEFVFEPPRMGFKTVSSDGSEEPYHETAESGSCFLLITNQRILYIAGMNDHDVSQQFKFGEISSVDVSTDILSPSIMINSSDGEMYKFTGLRDNMDDVNLAGKFILSKIK